MPATPVLITMADSGKTYSGKLDNISANGFAFLSSDPVFTDAKGQSLTITINDFALASHNVLDGRIIRCPITMAPTSLAARCLTTMFISWNYIESRLRDGAQVFSRSSDFLNIKKCAKKSG